MLDGGEVESTFLHYKINAVLHIKCLKAPLLHMYSLRFISKVTFGHNLCYETKDTFGEISFKLRQTNWNVAINNVNVVVDELPSQSTNNLHLFNN